MLIKCALSNINPMFLVQEHNIINQTRKCCALYFEDLIWAWEDGRVRGPDWSVARFAAWASARNVACLAVHQARPCLCDPNFWVELDSLSDITTF